MKNNTATTAGGSSRTSMESSPVFSSMGLDGGGGRQELAARSTTTTDNDDNMAKGGGDVNVNGDCPPPGVNSAAAEQAVHPSMLSSTSEREGDGDPTTTPPNNNDSFRRQTPLEKDHQNDEIAQEETKRLMCLRGIFVVFFVVCTLLVSLGVYYFLRQTEEKRFEEKFYDTGTKVLEAIGTLLVENTLTAVDTFATSTTTFARYTTQQQNLTSYVHNNTTYSGWPFVTLPEYAVQGSKLRSLSKIFLLTTYHYIDHEYRDAWEAYSRANDQWVNEGIETQKTDPTFRGNIVEEWSSLGEINYWGQRAEDAPYYVARWQSSPIVPRWDPYNWNAHQHPTIQPAMETVLRNKTVVLSESFNIVPPNYDPDKFPDNNNDEFATSTVNLQDFIGQNQYNYEPFVELYMPVLDGPPNIVSYNDPTLRKEDLPVVAVMAVSMFWRDLITDVLPIGNQHDIHVVFESACKKDQQSFTYTIHGPTAEYIGIGDQHEGKYEDKSMSSLIVDLTMTTTTNFGNNDDNQKTSSSSSSSYTGPPLESDFCPYRVTLYPSQAMADEYLTSTPVVLTCVSVAIFVLTASIFLAYDYLVKSRHRKVLWTAKQSSAVVASLFPSTLEASKYDKSKQQQQQQQQQQDNDNNTQGGGAGQGLMDRLVGSISPSSNSKKLLRTASDADPIAESFAQTTVLFAKLDGFAKWSAGRSNPTEVFILLERLFAAVDVLAERRGMYKVENIGDQYVAVSGIPEQRSDHALAMAKFALDVRTKVQVLTRQLAERLGDDTKELRVRIGIDSGDVVAGILRGQRARSFKLLDGETVQMARRMMETGRGDSIQVSADTADLIAAAGKGHWLKQREESLDVPDKGSVVTYWVEGN